MAPVSSQPSSSSVSLPAVDLICSRPRSGFSVPIWLSITTSFRPVRMMRPCGSVVLRRPVPKVCRLTSPACTSVPAVTMMSRCAVRLPRSSMVLVALMTMSEPRPRAIRSPSSTTSPAGFSAMPPDRVSSTPVAVRLTFWSPLDAVPAYMLMPLYARIQPEIVISPLGASALPRLTIEPRLDASIA